MMQDAEGRWFSFCVDQNSVMILEKQKLPEHLVGLPCVESPTVLSSILRELEDAGEVPSQFEVSIKTLPTIWQASASEYLQWIWGLWAKAKTHS